MIGKIAVDLRSTINLVGTVTKWTGTAFLLPLISAIVYKESIFPYLISLLLSTAIGFGLEHFAKESREIGLREGFLAVSLVWLLLAFFGSLPYMLSGHSLIDAYFEAMSGFTTTGASIMRRLEDLPRALLLWRAFTQWLGGMGIIVLAIAILPKLAVGGRQLMDAEVPGPELEKLTPRIRQTARALWKVYVGLTVAQTALLMLAGLSLYDALAHTFTTLATGGFSTKSSSIAAFSSTAQWIIILFMFLAGTNFALLYRGLKKPKAIFLDAEFRFYAVIVAIAVILLLLNLLNAYNFGEGLRHSAFQAISIMTTTGFASTDFESWNSTCKLILLILMFFGGSAGSTAGAIKVIRWLVLFKFIAREIKRIIHPQAIISIRLSQKVVDEDVIRGVAVFTILYVAIFAFASIAVLLDTSRVGLDLSVLEGVSLVATTLGNVGPGFGIAGPMGSYADFPSLTKLMLILLMWLGRLEIFPVLVLFTRSYWRE